jgi:nitrogen-specific signal transduction histidine kinase/CheY-like chemotaxis protein
MSGATGILQDNYRRSLKRAALQEKQVFLDAQVQQSRNLDLLARVAAGFAHDFNNLLMILSGASELLDHSLAPESLSRVYVGQIQQSTARAAGITRQLLAFSRKQVLDLQPMELHAALTGAQSVLSHLLGPAIELKFSLEADLSWICSDMSQIERVILNLASNARDAMPGGGQLTISTRNTHEIPAIAPASSNTAKWLALEVRDTGTGMDKPTLAQIFEPFFTTKPIGKGPGLGLSAVYGIVRQSGGFVQARSEPSKGACFEIYFPAIAPPAAFALTFASPTRSPLPETATVLLVDDEPALVHAIGEFLRDCGYIVLDAFSAQDALDLAREHPAKIDLLVTDVVMPQLRGPDLHRQVIELQPNIRVLFMSGYADGLPEMKLPVGALFLQKPFPFSALLEMLRHLQSRH